MDKNVYLKRLDNDPARRLLFSKVLDRFFLCVTKGVVTYTDFFDPFSCEIFLKALDGIESEAFVGAFGGAPGCERRMLGFAPADSFDTTLKESDFPVQRLRLSFNTKHSHGPRHQDILGAVLGLGIDRGRVGDISLLGDRADMFVHQDVSGFIVAQMDKAGRTAVSVSIADMEEDWDEIPLVEKILTVSSLRLDAVAAAAFHLPRGQAASLIGSGKAFINWVPVSKADKLVKADDVITLRGYGRVCLLEVDRKTKKDRCRIKAAVPLT